MFVVYKISQLITVQVVILDTSTGIMYLYIHCIVYTQYTLESESDKKDFEILVRDVDLNGLPTLKWH